MFFRGVIRGSLISIPIWLFFILLFKINSLFLYTTIFIGLAVAGLLFFFALRSPSEMKIPFPCYEFRPIGNFEWNRVSEKDVMEKFVEYFNPVTPVISRILDGEEIIVSKHVYRLLTRGVGEFLPRPDLDPVGH